MLFSANAGILMMNLLPCLPLDGGRMLALLLSIFLPAGKVRTVMRWMGIIIGAGCMALSAYATWQTGAGQFTIAACGCVMMYAAHSSTITGAMAELSQWMARKIRMERKGVTIVRTLAVMEDVSLRQALLHMPQRAWTEVLILQRGTMHVLGRCGEEQLIAAYMDAPGESCSVLLHGQNL